jgi:hypothetical protein
VSKTAFRIALLASTVVVFAVVLLAFASAPGLGAAYARLVAPLGTALPVPTVDVALPLLRASRPGSLDGLAVPAWVSVVWGLLLVGPWAAFAWTLRAVDVPSAVVRWVAAASLYAAFAVALAAAILLGLALPFGLL